MRNIILAFLIASTFLAHGQRYQLSHDSANFFMQEKQYNKALLNFRQSFKQGNTDLFDYYNAACAAALTQHPDEAFGFLNKSIDRGYMDKPWAEQDADFNSLHNDSRWSQAMRKLENQPRVMAKKFAAIKGKDPAALIPFKLNDLWGYLDKKSLKVLVRPEFTSLSFMNGCAEAVCYDGTALWIDPTGELMEVVHRDHGYPDLAIAALDDTEGPFPISSADGFKGFKMNEKKEITHFSDIYHRVTPAMFNISGPYLINGKYYAIADKDDASGVIDEEGNSLPGFDFVHRHLTMNSRSKDGDTWFYYEDMNGKKGFMNSSGKKKLEGELLDYAFMSNNRFDYGLQRGKDTYGIIDLRTMEWVIKPQPLVIQSLNGTTKAPCKKYTDKREDLIDVYFLVYDRNANPDVYYIDREMKVYKPR